MKSRGLVQSEVAWYVVALNYRISYQGKGFLPRISLFSWILPRSRDNDIRSPKNSTLVSRIIRHSLTQRKKVRIKLLTCVIKSIKCTPCLLSAKIWSPPFSFPSGTLFTAKKLDPNNGHFHKISASEVKYFLRDINID